MIYPARHIILWFLRTFGYGGITLPPFGVYIVPDRLYEDSLRKHELTHWEQYKRMGLIRFYATYLWFNLRYGYKNNPMEIEARANM